MNKQQYQNYMSDLLSFMHISELNLCLTDIKAFKATKNYTASWKTPTLLHP